MANPNPWAYKPWWCQPWSIALTGIGLIAGSWLALHRLWVTGLVAVPVLSWMGFFLLIWPRLVVRSWLASSPPDTPLSQD
ncbi:DUF6737 family protein [Trichothermofontia sp.]